MGDQPVTLAAIIGAHGIGGEVRLKLFAEAPESLARHKTVQVGGRMLTLKSVKAGGGTPIARFAEITDRTAAEALRGELVTVPRSALPPLADDEYYHADLIGLPCADASGVELGVVVSVENFGAGDILEIEKSDGKRAMVPFRAGIADLAGDRIEVDPAFLV
ncbi:ribosome maturation factor RimM [Sphingosinicella humi]|uniref:Ribosome maturation factor RimM n=1 Tax=Allosphingosinicella humi TaxID=2068657 RepID=A0A2U2J5L7_9SPHN|nr:ribosome maturation factor RimM [Sphingosinicella humi]PWG03624.1 16S rRNA processing protein RimM [Sphingosinicella humi]